MMLVLHDDPVREYAYGPANGLPDSKVGTFSDALMDEAKKGWMVISMKNDWKRISISRSSAKRSRTRSWRGNLNLPGRAGCTNSRPEGRHPAAAPG